jgi:hypothetical protein
MLTRKDVQFGTQVTLLALVPCNHGRWVYLVHDLDRPETNDDPEVLAIYVDPQPLELVRKRFALHLQQSEWTGAIDKENEGFTLKRNRKVDIKEMYLPPNH